MLVLSPAGGWLSTGLRSFSDSLLAHECVRRGGQKVWVGQSLTAGAADEGIGTAPSVGAARCKLALLADDVVPIAARCSVHASPLAALDRAVCRDLRHARRLPHREAGSELHHRSSGGDRPRSSLRPWPLVSVWAHRSRNWPCA